MGRIEEPILPSVLGSANISSHAARDGSRACAHGTRGSLGPTWLQSVGRYLRALGLERPHHPDFSIVRPVRLPRLTRPAPQDSGRAPVPCHTRKHHAVSPLTLVIKDM